MPMAIRAVVRQLGGSRSHADGDPCRGPAAWGRPCGIGPWHSVGTNEGLIDALDALEDGDTATAAEAFGNV